MGKDNENTRHSLIHLIRSGKSPEEAAEELEYSPSWAYKWWGRFNESGWEGLKSRSRAPQHHPNRISPKMERRILEIRRQLEKEAEQADKLSYTGAYAIRGRLLESHLKDVPSPSTIEKTLRLAGMTKPPCTQAEKETVYPYLQIDQPHQLTQLDIVPHYLSGGALAHCFNAIDVRSRYPDGKQYERKTTSNVLDFCLKIFQNIGISEFTQLDNESSFNGGRTHPYVIGRVARLMLLVGTQLVYSPFYHPESNAYVERFHQDYGKNVWEKVPMRNLPEVHQVASRFFARYRISKHHSELDGQSPASVHFERPFRILPNNFIIPKPLPITEGKIHFMRAVAKSQSIPICNVDWSTGLAEPDQGVWATLFITLRGARLRIYDQAPGTFKRRCFADHPFPLFEPVMPLSAKFQKPKITWLESLFKLPAMDSTMS